jgi:signal peptidase I
MTKRRSAIGAAAALVAVALGWLLLAPQQLGGSTAYVSTHGISMEPRFHTGDLAVLRQSDTYGVGDVVAYHSSVMHSVVMHRIVAARAGRYAFKGDNNSWLDPERPTRSQLIGKLAVRIPHGGVWLTRATSPVALALLMAVVLAVGTTTVQTRRSRRKGGRVSRHAAPRSSPRRSLGWSPRRSPRRSLGWSLPRSVPRSVPRSLPAAQPAALPAALRTAASAAAVAAVAAGALGAIAWTRPTTTTAIVSSAQSQSMVFSYSASVPKTPAYDGTTVTSPDPVFRKLAKTVTVRYVYAGPPGTIAVVARLSSPGGWHATLPLRGSAAVPETRYAGTLSLDLAQIDARTRAAAAITGLPADRTTVTVAPTVHLTGGGTFAPALDLTLSPLMLSLGNNPKALTVTDTTDQRHTVRVSKSLHLLGRQLAVSAARVLSAGLLLAALAALAVIAFLARRAARTSEGERIRRYYGQLLVAVQPVPAPAGRPLVDVPEFTTLVRIAERYGLLILHWSRSDVETFLVQDDATTYRYRTGVPAAEPELSEPDRVMTRAGSDRSHQA